MSFFENGSKQYWVQKALLNGDKAIQHTIASGNAQDLAQSAQKKAQETGENLNLAHHHIFQLKNELDEAVEINKKLFQATIKYKEEAEYYKKLLAKPMVEIAEENHDFKKAYETQMELLADWMVSQKAFKELAIQFGIEKGLNPDQIREMGQAKKIDVLNDAHNESHKTNSKDMIDMTAHVNRLKSKLK